MNATGRRKHLVQTHWNPGFFSWNHTPGYSRAIRSTPSPDVPQAQGVRHDRNGAESHCGGGKHRIQQNAEKRIERSSGNRNTGSIVEKGPEKILLDGAHGKRRKLYSGSDQRQIVPYEGNIACLDCYVRARPDCIPTSDAARAGASFMPSPTMAVTLPSS